MIKTNVKGKGATINAIKKELAKYENAPNVFVGIRGEAGKHPDSDISMAQLGGYTRIRSAKCTSAILFATWCNERGS